MTIYHQLKFICTSANLLKIIKYSEIFPMTIDKINSIQLIALDWWNQLLKSTLTPMSHAIEFSFKFVRIQNCFKVD